MPNDDQYSGPADDLSFLRPRPCDASNHDGQAFNQAANAAGRYTNLRKIGQGSFAIVYQATDQHLAREVALKTLLSGSRATAQQRRAFTAEAQRAASLQHPNIVQIFEVSEIDGAPFLSMGLIEADPNKPSPASNSPGSSSPQRPSDLGRRYGATKQAPRTAAQFVAVLAEAMQYAHTHGIVHRDLSPRNILLARSTPALGVPLEVGAFFQPVISDFGLAAAAAPTSEPSMKPRPIGTPGFMSPEQAAGKPAQTAPSTDIHSLGAILYYVLTGRPPFKGDTDKATIEATIYKEPVLPSKIASISKDLEKICLKALQKNPSDRYAHAQELADDLRAFLGGHDIKAAPPAFFRRQSRRLGRLVHARPRASLLVSLFLFTSLGAAYAGYSHYNANRERLRRSLDDGRTLIQIGDLQAKTGQVAEAEHTLLRAKTILESYLGEVSPAPAVELDLAEIASTRARMNYQSFRLAGGAQAPDAVALFTEAAASLERLYPLMPTDVRVRRDLIDAYVYLGVLKVTGEDERLDDPDGAIALYDKARPHNEFLANRFPDVEEFKRTNDLIEAGIHNNRGIALRRKSRPADALTEFQEARRLRRLVSDKDPGNLDRLAEVAAVYHNEGLALQDMAEAAWNAGDRVRGRQLLQSALQQISEASRIQQDVHARAPLVVEWRRRLGDYYKSASIMHLDLGEPVVAGTFALKCRDLWPRQPRELWLVACHLGLCLDEAAQHAARLSQADRAELGKFADLGIESLRAAIDNGFKDLKKLKEDTDLAPIRRLKTREFAALVQRLEVHAGEEPPSRASR